MLTDVAPSAPESDPLPCCWLCRDDWTGICTAVWAAFYNSSNKPAEAAVGMRNIIAAAIANH